LIGENVNVAREIERLQEYCKDNSIPLTQQRIEVFRELVWSKNHPSPEEIHKRVQERFPTISLATVYKNLEALSRIGFARKINPLSDRARYDHDLSPHSHFICTSCKNVFDIESKALERLQIPDPEDFEHEISLKMIVITGICNQCKNNTQDLD
jgi:Fur family peroxide stress response transcriptional regulator